MRTLTAALALVLVACGSPDRDDSSAARDASARLSRTGPDPLVLRVPRDGGAATVSAYPALDSVVWRSDARLPALDRVLAFDAEGGSLAFVARDGTPGRLDLRLGTVGRQREPRLQALESVDGYAIYGVNAKGAVVRLTPAGEPWSLTPPAPARLALPQPDGWLLVLADRGDETIVWRLRPPEKRLIDTLSLPRATRAAGTRVGDRIYLAADERLIGVRSRGLEELPGVEFDAPVRALATTPSGDRIYVAVDSSREVAVVGRYSEEVDRRIELPGPVRDLRMDPLGRYLLVRPANGDSAWVVSVSSGAVTGSVRTGWRTDLPFVAPDGAIALVRGDDVVFVDGRTLRPVRTVDEGAADFWYPFLWTGFRPRSEDLDEPVEFRRVEPAPDTTAVPPPDTGAAYDTIVPPPDTTRRAPRPAARPTPPPVPSGYYVSFAALLNRDRARDLASQIEVGGQRAHVLEAQQAGTPIYRVVLGPYGSRADADRAGRASGRTYFIYEGTP
ncbi:MAG TPA: SPOR domain-containing protein [Gemmatimonadaceae bacterium]|nr:SPOR domain-containing protein [Gemmatimonadaceae bacterium]